MKTAWIALVIAVAPAFCFSEEEQEQQPVAVADDQALADKDRELAEEEKSRVIKPLAEALRREEQSLKDATKARDKEKIAEAKAKVAAARRSLNQSKQLTLAEWLGVARSRLKAEQRDGDLRAAADEAAAKKMEESAASRAEAAKTRPLAIVGTKLVRNVIGLPELTVRVENLTNQPVEAFTIDAECFNKFDEPVKAPFKGNVFSGMSQSTVAPGAKENSTWQLSLHGGTGYAKVWLSRVRFADGKELTQTKEEAAQCKGLFKATLRE